MESVLHSSADATHEGEMSNKDTWYYEAEDELIYDIKDVKPGLAFNDWILVKYWGRGSRGYEFLFQCKCGKERVCGLLDMRSGRSKSCRKCSAAGPHHFSGCPDSVERAEAA